MYSTILKVLQLQITVMTHLFNLSLVDIDELINGHNINGID